MILVKQLFFDQLRWFRIDRLEHQLKDYVETTLKLFWQRQTVFLFSMILTISYFDSTLMLFCYVLILITEMFDVLIARSTNEWVDLSPSTANKFLTLIMANTILSASAIGFWVTLLAQQQGVGGHFMPLFFLFSASLFAAMHNHQLMPVLSLRLIIYGAAFLLIPLQDIWLVRPDLGSELWLNFFTVVFVLYFIIDSSLSFIRLYRNGLRQLEELSLEYIKSKAAHEAKAEFVAVISHELRTPLTSIKGALDMVNLGALGPVPKKMNKALKLAGDNGDRLANLIDDLLDIQKMEAETMIFRFDKLNVSQLIRDAVNSTSGLADSRGITINAVLAEGDVFINGDKSRLMQVMTNLLSNALKFSHEGDCVEVSFEATHDKVRILVKDSGIGIPEGSEDKVFGKFSQVDSSDKRQFGGTGLGMNLSKRIVERHNGNISYISKLGSGTTFCCEFERT